MTKNKNLGIHCYQAPILKKTYSEADYKKLYGTTDSINLFINYPLTKYINNDNSQVSKRQPANIDQSIIKIDLITLYNEQNNFESQFINLIGSFKQWGMKTAVIDRKKKLNKFASNIFESNNDGDFIYAIRQSSSYFETIKTMLERIRVELDNINLGLAKRKRIFIELTDNITVCAPGVYQHISYVYNQLCIEESPTNWLMEYRASIVSRYSSKYKTEKKITAANQIHVDNVLLQYANDQGWHINLIKQKYLNEIFANSTQINSDDIVDFHAFFEIQYSLKNIHQVLKLRLLQITTKHTNKFIAAKQYLNKINRLTAINYVDAINQLLNKLDLIDYKLDLYDLFDIEPDDYEIVFTKAKLLSTLEVIIFNYCIKKNIFTDNNLKQLTLKNTNGDYLYLSYIGTDIYSLQTAKQYKLKLINTLETHSVASRQNLIEFIKMHDIQLWPKLCTLINDNSKVNLDFASTINYLLENNLLAISVNSSNDFSVIIKNLKPDEYQNLYKKFKNHLLIIFQSATDYSTLSKTLTTDQYILVCESMLENINKTLSNKDELSKFLKNLTPEQYQSIHIFFQVKMKILLPNIECFSFVLNELPKELKRIFCESHFDLLKKIIKTSDDYKKIVSNLFLGYGITITKLPPVDILSLIMTMRDYGNIIWLYDKKQADQTYKIIQSKLPEMIKNKNDLVYLIRYVDETQYIEIFNKIPEVTITVILTWLSLSSENFWSIFHKLAPNKCQNLLKSLQSIIPKTLTNNIELLKGFEYLTIEQAKEVFKYLEPQLHLIINNYNEYTSSLLKLKDKPSQLTIFLNAIQSNLFVMKIFSIRFIDKIVCDQWGANKINIALSDFNKQINNSKNLAELKSELTNFIFKIKQPQSIGEYEFFKPTSTVLTERALSYLNNNPCASLLINLLELVSTDNLTLDDLPGEIETANLLNVLNN